MKYFEAFALSLALKTGNFCNETISKMLTSILAWAHLLLQGIPVPQGSKLSSAPFFISAKLFSIHSSFMVSQTLFNPITRCAYVTNLTVNQ